MEKQQTNIWNFRVRPVDEPMIARLNRAAVATDRPASQIVREAIREKLDELAARYPQIDAVPQQQTATN